jgi:hypothetical protein
MDNIVLGLAGIANLNPAGEGALQISYCQNLLAKSSNNKPQGTTPLNGCIPAPQAAEQPLLAVLVYKQPPIAKTAYRVGNLSNNLWPSAPRTQPMSRTHHATWSSPTVIQSMRVPTSSKTRHGGVANSKTCAMNSSIVQKNQETPCQESAHNALNQWCGARGTPPTSGAQ